MCTLDHMQSTFFCLRKFLKKLDNLWSSITKGSIYHIKNMYIQPFSMVVDWPEIWCLMEVSTMFHIPFYQCYARLHLRDAYLLKSWQSTTQVVKAEFRMFLRQHWNILWNMKCGVSKVIFPSGTVNFSFKVQNFFD